MGSFDWCEIFSNAQVTNPSFNTPIIKQSELLLGPSWVSVKKAFGKSKNGRFYFEEVWATNAKCRDVVASTWLSDEAHGGIADEVNRLRCCAKKIDA